MQSTASVRTRAVSRRLQASRIRATGRRRPGDRWRPGRRSGRVVPASARRATGRSFPCGKTSPTPFSNTLSTRPLLRASSRITESPHRSDRFGPEVLGNLDVEEDGESSHLALEIGLQIVVVHEEGETLVPQGPPRRQMGDRGTVGRPLIEQFVHITVPRRQRRKTFLQSARVQEVDEFRSHRTAVIRPRHQRVASISVHRDVLALLEDRHTISGRVGLDVTPMFLRVELGEEIIEWNEPGVDPWAPPTAIVGRVASRPQQRRHDALHPGGAALWRGTDKDVVRPMLEVAPAKAVFDRSAKLACRLTDLDHGPPYLIGRGRSFDQVASQHVGTPLLHLWEHQSGPLRTRATVPVMFGCTPPPLRTGGRLLCSANLRS